jgi:hypothetical protein
MKNNPPQILATTTILTIVLSPNCLASNLVSWTISGPGTTNGQQLAANEWQLDYTFEPAGFSTQTWTVQAIAPADGDYTFDWDYNGFHAFFEVTAFLNIVISNKNETLGNTISTNNFIKGCPHRSIHSGSL